jgi:hypothetical protein
MSTRASPSPSRNCSIRPLSRHRRTLAISQEEVGLLAGVSRQRINQALQNLERLQILRLSYNQIDVLDLDRLCVVWSGTDLG